ncbi:MAG: hypothetical protein AAF654_01120 [Myxococcota bacterium]
MGPTTPYALKIVNESRTDSELGRKDLGAQLKTLSEGVTRPSDKTRQALRLAHAALASDYKPQEARQAAMSVGESGVEVLNRAIEAAEEHATTLARSPIRNFLARWSNSQLVHQLGLLRDRLVEQQHAGSRSALESCT